MRKQRNAKSEALPNEERLLPDEGPERIVQKKTRTGRKRPADQLESVSQSIAEREKLSIIAIDYSYEECGFAMFDCGVLKEVTKLNFKELEEKNNLKLNNKKRRALLRRYIQIHFKNYYLFVVERVRLFSHGFVSKNSIVALAEIVVTIVDALPDYCTIVSEDTRSWKKAATGSSKTSKQETIAWANDILTEEVKKKREYSSLTDNEADAIGIGYGFYRGIGTKDEV